MSRKLKQPQWIEFPEDKEIQFLIKPFSPLYLKKLPSEQKEDVDPSIMLDIFIKCVLDWKGILDSKDQLIQCNRESKEEISYQNLDLLTFVFSKAIDLSGIKVPEEEAKN